MIGNERAEHDANTSARAEGASPKRGEVVVLSLALAVQIALRVLYALHHEVDSDEPQHLHVVWGWTQGLVQYRDVFDNHAPLFHLLMTPFVGLIGERADIITFARWLMFPFVAVTIWATYRIGRALWSQRVGLWAGALTGIIPSFLLTSTEFRPDDLWMASWLSSLVVLMTGALDARRGFLAGFLLGATVATSLKTMLLILALAAAAITFGLSDRWGGRVPAKQVWRTIAPMVLGFAILPITLIAIFWRLHALDALSYCTVGHNIVPGLGLWRSAPDRLLILPAALLILPPLGGRILRRQPPSDLHRNRVLLILTTALYVALLESCWPLITSEDFLPWTPMAVLVAVAAAHESRGWLQRAWPGATRTGLSTATLLAAVVTCLVIANRMEVAWLDTDQKETRLLQAVIGITGPTEPIIDLKGESIFRPRPYYYALEGVTRWRLESGLLSDSIAADVMRSRTHFAVPDSWLFPPAARRFLNEHFVSIGPLRVLGTDLGSNSNPPGAPRRFNVSYAERFAVVADGRTAAGSLDGIPYREPALLQPGSHCYRPLPSERNVQVVWAGALRSGLGLQPMPGMNR
jgi:dolichyl-phosphate-mannose-protein mannosyltransferase